MRQQQLLLPLKILLLLLLLQQQEQNSKTNRMTHLRTSRHFLKVRTNPERLGFRV